jgi:hypothetical protein
LQSGLKEKGEIWQENKKSWAKEADFFPVCESLRRCFVGESLLAHIIMLVRMAYF